jgi:hypothetical protein
MLAAEATDHAGDPAGAAELAGRAAERFRGTDFDDGGALAYRGSLLLRAGRDADGLAVLAALRPRLVEDPEAPEYVAAALVEADRAAVAEQWLTEALTTMLDRRSTLADKPDSPEFEEASLLAFALLRERHAVRHELDLPHDEHDDLAEELEDALEEELAGGAALFLPRAEHDRMLARTPELAEVLGPDWDAHRGSVEAALRAYADPEHRPRIVVGTADGLSAHLTEAGGDPTDPAAHLDYIATLLDGPAELAWPPGRNDPCWCGSGDKYKKCCEPRYAD